MSDCPGTDRQAGPEPARKTSVSILSRSVKWPHLTKMLTYKNSVSFCQFSVGIAKRPK